MLIDKFVQSTGVARWILIIPAFLGIAMILRLSPKIGWISRWGIAFSMGIGAGIGITSGVHGYVLPQMKATFVPVYTQGNPGQSINNIILIVGTATSILYFYFSKEHKGRFKIPIRVGMCFIMIAFGASFGYTVMARFSLLIGRIYFLLHDWLHVIQ
jgi:hypothetical protein